jgi:hypothetical protein
MNAFEETIKTMWLYNPLFLNFGTSLRYIKISTKQGTGVYCFDTR